MSLVSKLKPSFMALATLAVSLPVQAQDAQFSSLTLRQAVDRALERNPLVVESTLEWRRTKGAAEGVAGVLAENPVVEVETGVRRVDQLIGNQGSFSARVDQPLDLFGQAGARRRAAGDVVSWTKSRVDLARTEVAARARILYVAAQVAVARIALDEERLAMARRTAEAVKTRVSLGASSDIDLGMAQAEVARAEAALRSAKGADTQSRLALRELLELPASVSVRPNEKLMLPPAQPLQSNPSLLAHPSLRAVEKRETAIDSEIARLRSERLPRISIGVAGEVPSDQERFYGVVLTVAPAVWRRNQGPLAEAHVERERAAYEKGVTLAGLERRWAALQEENVLRQQELAAVEEALRNEENVRALVRTGWEAGKFDFLRVLLAERSLADTKQARLDLWADLWLNVIEMKRLLGQEL